MKMKWWTIFIYENQTLGTVGWRIKINEKIFIAVTVIDTTFTVANRKPMVTLILWVQVR